MKIACSDGDKKMPESIYEDVKEIEKILNKMGINIEPLIKKIHINKNNNGARNKDYTFEKGKQMAIYFFAYNEKYLKIGQAYKNSKARFNSQHYRISNKVSSLAKSIKNDDDFRKKNGVGSDIGTWIRENTIRYDVILEFTKQGEKDKENKQNKFILDFIESYFHLKYNPKYEGKY